MTTCIASSNIVSSFLLFKVSYQVVSCVTVWQMLASQRSVKLFPHFHVISSESECSSEDVAMKGLYIGFFHFGIEMYVVIPVIVHNFCGSFPWYGLHWYIPEVVPSLVVDPCICLPTTDTHRITDKFGSVSKGAGSLFSIRRHVLIPGKAHGHTPVHTHWTAIYPRSSSSQ